MQQNQFNQFIPIVQQPRAQAQPSVSKGNNGQGVKNRYDKLYQKALKNKIVQLSMQQQFENQSGKSVNKNGTNHHIPSSNSIQVSSLELIEFVLREHEQANHEMLKSTNTKDSYTIYEDLKVIYFLGCTEDQINKAQFQKISEEGYVSRSSKSIRKRYNEYLKYLNKNDIVDILSYIDTFGLKGYLIFEKDPKGGRQLQRIQKQDPTQNNQDNNQQNQNQLQIGSSQNLSTSFTPQKSPGHGMNQDGQLSPNGYPVSPQNRLIINPQLQNSNNSMSFIISRYPYPFKQMSSPMFYDSQPKRQIILPSPYYPYMHDGYPSFINQGRHSDQMNPGFNNEEEGDSNSYEVRPSQKKGSVSKQKRKEMEDEDEISENIMKKKKNNDSNEQKNIAQSIPQNPQKLLNKQQKTQNLDSNQQQKIQSTLVLPNVQGVYLSKPSIISQKSDLHTEIQFKQSPENDKPLTKEVYELIRDDDKISEDEFECLIEYVSQQIKMPKDELIDKLDLLSGSFQDFNLYLKQNKNEGMLWNINEDKILEKISSPDQQELKLFITLKGLESIKKRLIYKKIKLPFNLN